MWAQASDADVRLVIGDKVYRCPGCDHEIRAGEGHEVVVPRNDPGARRHWHSGCWFRETRSPQPAAPRMPRWNRR